MPIVIIQKIRSVSIQPMSNLESQSACGCSWCRNKKDIAPARHSVGLRLHVSSMLGKAIRLSSMLCILLLHVLKLFFVSNNVVL